MRIRRTGAKALGWALPLVLAAVCLFFTAVLPMEGMGSRLQAVPQTFVGEYSYDGRTWQELTDRSNLSALRGDLWLRGHFTREMPGTFFLHYYRDHIGVSVDVNGEVWFRDIYVSDVLEGGEKLAPYSCGATWEMYASPGISVEDEVEIRLYNLHEFGNKHAYRHFLQTLRMTDLQYFSLVEDGLSAHGLPFRLAGGLLAAAALLLLGAALAAVILRLFGSGRQLFCAGLITLCAAGFAIFDTIDIGFWSESVAMNTAARQLCMMMFVFYAGCYVRDDLTGTRRKLARAALALSCGVNCLLLVLAAAGVTVIYSTGLSWAVSQALLCPLLAVLCARELRTRPREKWLIPLSGLLLFAAVLLDLGAVGETLFSSAVCTKAVFLGLLCAHIIAAGKSVVANHWAMARAERLEQELEDSRIALMLSQIRPHFLYNALGAIRSLCRQDPERAWQALGDFSGYLRGNMSALSNHRTIHFTAELRHVEAYLRLEKMLMEDDLDIRYDIEEQDFFLPPLTIQPLVENAVQHGLFEKEGGGTLYLRTRREGENVVITVEDTGVGFVQEDLRQPDENHARVGLANVRSRLETLAGGRLEIHSTPGQGTVVTVTLRREEEKEGGQMSL